ncbi:hypothetical protein MMC21_003499 [Puttea exsequens]|nr:hypothetical protein [Puttea exsequens]
MSTAGNIRATRSASRARSDDGAAPAITPIASRTARNNLGGTPARTNRRLGARRAASPAVVDDDDKPEVSSKTNQAYGTQGKPARIQQLSKHMAMTQAVNSIASAVSNAEAAQPKTRVNGNGLPVLDEEEDEAEEENEPEAVSSVASERQLESADIHSRNGSSCQRDRDNSVAPSPDGPSIFSLQYWAPRYAPMPAAGRPSDLSANQRILRYMQSRGTKSRIPMFVPEPTLLQRTRSTVALTYAITIGSVLALMLYLAWLGPVLGSSPLKSANDIPEPSSSIIQQVVQTTSHQYDRLSTRLAAVEKRMQKLSSGAKSLDASPKHQINWFAPGWGATIDSHLSSPTATVCDRSWSPLPWIFLRSCSEMPLSPPQSMVLRSWDDAGRERWCAPKSPGGKLQLTVEISRLVVPTELVIEYVAKDAAPKGYMGSAPKEVELWIQIQDDEARTKIGDAITQMHPGLWDESKSQGRELAIAQTLGYDYVPIGRWTYNIYENQAGQAFRVPIPLHEYGVGTAKVAVRVNSNWGNEPFTCINRLRLYGDDVSGRVEILEPEPGRGK